MMREQLIPAFIAALLAEGVTNAQVEDAITHVNNLELGASIIAVPELTEEWYRIEKFINEQAHRLEP